MTGRARWWRGVLALGATGIVAASVPVIGTTPSYAADPTVSIVSAKTTGFINGDAVIISGAGFPPNIRVEINQCVGDREYPIGERLNDTVAINGFNYRKKALYCTSVAPANNQGVGSTYFANVDANGTLLARVVLFQGTGTVGISPTPQTTPKVTINPMFDHAHPGTVVLRDASAASTKGNMVYGTVPATFAADSASACAAGDGKTATAVGGVASTPLYLTLVTAMCGTSGIKLPVDMTETGETVGLQNFRQNQADMAFSAVGFSPPGGVQIEGTRKAVFIPIALQGAALAFGGNSVFGTTSASYRTIAQVQCTPAEAAALMRGNVFPGSSPKAATFLTRNTSLPQDPNQPVVLQFAALAVDDSSTLAATTMFTASDTTPNHADWPIGTVPRFPLPSTGIPITPSLSLGANATSLRNIALKNQVDANSSPIAGIAQVVTDTSSTATIGMIPMEVQNASGRFVGPTKESIAAAVSQMTKLPDGTLFPNPKATGDGVYVLPLVMYAVIPEDASAPHRENVVKFLDYALGDGQAKLPAGTYPLPADMVAAAKKALHPAAPPPKNNQNNNNSKSNNNSNNTSSNTTTPPNTGGGAALAGSRPTTATGAKNAANTVNNLDIPLFPGLSAASGWLAPIGLALLVALSASVAYVSSGRPLPGPVQAALEFATARLRAATRRLPHWLPGVRTAT